MISPSTLSFILIISLVLVAGSSLVTAANTTTYYAYYYSYGTSATDCNGTATSGPTQVTIDKCFHEQGTPVNSSTMYSNISNAAAGGGAGGSGMGSGMGPGGNTNSENSTGVTRYYWASDNNCTGASTSSTDFNYSQCTTFNSTKFKFLEGRAPASTTPAPKNGVSPFSLTTAVFAILGAIVLVTFTSTF